MAPQKNKQNRPNFPHDLIYEILLRLPVSSIVRLKYLSQFWKTQFSETKFIRSHFKTNPVYNTLFYNTTAISELKIRHGGQGFPELVRIPPPHPLLHHFDFTMTHCDGLMCLSYHNSPFHHDCIVIWNPTLRAKKLFGPIELPFRAYGFGYDSNLDDYKVVLLSQDSDENDIKCLNLKTGSWYSAKTDVTYTFTVSSGGAVSVGNCLYWIAQKENDNHVILCFDFASDTLREDADLAGSRMNFHPDLVALGNCLVLTAGTGDERDVWFRSGFGGTEIERWRRSGCRIPLPKLYGKLRNNKLLISETPPIKEIYAYDPKDGTVEKFAVDFFLTGVVGYVESLVSVGRSE